MKTVLRVHLPPTRDRELIEQDLQEIWTKFDFVVLPSGDVVRRKTRRVIAAKIVRRYDPSRYKEALFEEITKEEVEALKKLLDAPEDEAES